MLAWGVATGSFALRGMLVRAGGARRGAVVIEGGRIARVVEGEASAGLPAPVRDAAWIAPGFIDLQVNGGFGRDLVCDPDALAVLCRQLPSTGVTGFLPTLVSCGREVLRRAAGWPELAGAPAGGARPLGLHLEGPFLAPERAGAHDPAVIGAAEADPSLFEELVQLPHLRLVTLAPERPGALDRIRRLRAAGVTVSLGHSAAAADAVRLAADAGARMVTHLYNAMSGVDHRSPGLAGAALVDDRLALGLIADGVHVHPAALALAVRAAGPERIALVTDAMAAAGMEPGRYALAGRPVQVDERSARLADGTLAGSILTMDQAVRQMVALAGVAPEQALRMASAVPARVLGLPGAGELDAGAPADLVLLDPDLAVHATYIGGEAVHERAAR